MKLRNTLENLKRNSITKVALFYAVPSFILLVTTVYSGWFSSLPNTVNSDHVIYPLLFKGIERFDLVALTDHANFLKFPIYYLQSVFPYNLYTATIMNIGLFVVTIGSWALLLVYIFGKRYLPLIFLSTSAVILSAILLDYELVGPAIRNLEYPVALAFIVAVARFTSKKKLTKSWFGIVISTAILYAISVAGDSLLLYALTAPLLIALVLFSYRTKDAQSKKRLNIAVLITLGSTLLAFIIRWFVQITGITLLYENADEKLYTIPFEHLIPSISLSINQLLSLFGANIFGQPVGINLALPMVNFLLIILAVIGLIITCRNSYKDPQSKKYFKSSQQALILVTLALAFCTTLIAYIFLDLVVVVDPTGKFVTSGQDRYLTLLPFIALAGLAYFFTQYQKNTYRFIVYGVIILGILLSFTSLHHQRKSAYDNYGANLRWTLKEVSTTLESRNVDLLVAGYWYAAPASFYANGTNFISITNCNQPSPDFNIRKSFYEPSDRVQKSALIIDKQGPDARFWDCTDEQLTNIYGSPIEKIAVGAPQGTTLDIYIYDYDVRNKVAAPKS